MRLTKKEKGLILKALFFITTVDVCIDSTEGDEEEYLKIIRKLKEEKIDASCLEGVEIFPKTRKLMETPKVSTELKKILKELIK